MDISNYYKISAEHLPLWQKFTNNIHKKSLSHAILLVGSMHADLSDLALKMAVTLCCKALKAPCANCQACMLATQSLHPDISFLVPDKPRGSIKIDAIRNLNSIIFNSTQLGSKRIVIINPAERMNTAAANALLKILEEPPNNTHFILVAKQVSNIPATILSRVQIWRSQENYLTDKNVLSLGKHYSHDSEKKHPVLEQATIIDQLQALHDGRLSVNTLAETWLQYDLHDLVGLLYLLTAQMIHDYFCSSSLPSKPLSALSSLGHSLKPIGLFNQLDKLNDIIKNLTHTVSMNSLLLLENLLMELSV